MELSRDSISCFHQALIFSLCFKKEETEKISHDDDKRILKMPAKLKSKKRGKLSFYKYLKIQAGNVFLSLEFLILETEFLVHYMYRIS